MGLRLVPFEGRYGSTVLSWVRSDEELDAWASLTAAPDDDSIFDRWHPDPDVRPFLLFEGPELIGYGEVWEEADEGEAELARIIVAPERRGQGRGRAFVRLLLEGAQSRGFDDVWLRVVPWNEPALSCYSSAGFVRASTEQEAELNQAQPRAYVWLKYEGPDADRG